MTASWPWMFTLLFGFLLPWSGHSSTQKQGLALGEYPDYIIDTEGRLDFDKVLGASWQKHTQRNPSFGWSNSVVWIATEYEKRDAEPTVLEIAYSLLDHVELRVYRDQLLVQELKFGKVLPRPREMLDDVEPAFLLPQEPARYRLVFRIQSHSSLQLPLKIYDKYSFDYKEKEDFFITGAFAGILGIMAFYNFFIFLSSRNMSYCFYALFVASFLAVQLSMSGHLGSYLWPGRGYITDSFICQGSYLANIFMLLFADRYLGLSLRGTKSRIFVLAHFSLLISGLISSLILPYIISVKVIAAIAAGGSLSILSLAAYKAFHGQREAKFYCAAWTGLIAGGLIFIGKSFGFLPVNVFTTYAFRIGSVFEVGLLSLALADQLNQLRSQLSAALQDQIEHLKLQEKVASEREVYQQNLRFETEQRLGLAANVAHRLNNPLNYLSLGKTALGSLNKNLHRKIASIFSAQDEMDSEALALRNQFEQVFQQYDEALDLMSLGIEKASTTVTELKVLSGIERPTLEELGIDQLWHECLQRVQEGLGSAQVERLSLSISSSSTTFLGNAILTRFALERLLISLLGSQSGGISIDQELEGPGKWTIRLYSAHEIDKNIPEALQKSLRAILNPCRLGIECQAEGAQLSCVLYQLGLPASPLAELA